MRALLWCLVVACGRSEKDCPLEANALGTLLRAAAKESPSAIDIDPKVNLVVRDDLAQFVEHMAPTVTMRATETAYDGQVVDDAILRERLNQAPAELQKFVEQGKVRPRMVPEPKRVYFVLDAAVSASRLAAAVDAAHVAQMDAIGFVFAAPQTVKPPPGSAIDATLDKLVDDPDGANKAAELAKLVSARVKECPALVKLFGSISSDESMSMAMMIAKGTAPALIECGCKVNVPELRSVMFRVMHVEKPTRVILMDPAQPEETIEVAATDTWAAISKRLTSASKNVRFVVR